MKRVLAIDLGGTNLRSAVYAGDLLAMEMASREPAPASLDAFVARIRALSDAAGGIEALGIAIPGLAEGTICRWVPNLSYLDGVDLEALFPGLTIALGNDAQIALLAEAAEGAARGVSDAILLAIGTGIGSAVLANGRIVAGAHGGACSFGWACSDIDDAGDARSGWLERVASGRAFDDLAGRIGLASGADLIAAARAGDGAALALLEEPARRLGTALAGAVGLLDPGVILVSGGLADALDMIAPPLLAAMRRQLPPHLRGIELKPGAFGSRAGLIGAALAGRAGEHWRRIR
ncbi:MULTISPECIES: ROK family protein [unclassified Mesorhizobium]|uniref:ROK family protein n=1 Tax=unclassified Mesorhizobium TaxID=325217 RepID=UPI000967C908|nr:MULTISPECIES: ROK family protein [unclassified Mesorhizobium]MBN9257927.1 ROK family protein [Mesorhizobium sp.]MBN9273426.1 ROK family protein [Mesorhizobium sp.]OJX76183.1 MAG: sugar kinase [Mesorhizobium sp. 65-26]